VACLEQAKQFGGSDARCTLIGGGKANVVYAAQYNTALVRYIDFMDSYCGFRRRRTGFRGEAEQGSGVIPNTIPG
jgi:2-methylcitrate dehydratase PrpD